MFITKTRTIVVFAGIIAIWILSYALNLYGKKDSFRIESIVNKPIDEIKIYDHGLVGTRTVTVRDQQRLSNLIPALSKSTIFTADINFKDNHGLCDIIIYMKNGETMQMDLINTTSSGGILRSGGYIYRNDELLKMIMNMFR